MVEGWFFYILAIMLMGSAIMAISTRNPVHAVLFLIFAFFNAAGLFLMVGAEFLAFILMIVYIGAIAVLFLFVVMMLNTAKDSLASSLKKERWVAFGLCGLLLGELAIAIGGGARQTVLESTNQIENTRALGLVLYTDYAVAFHAAGIILLTAMIGAIVLTFNPQNRAKRQNAKDQKARDPKEVLEIHKITSGRGLL